MVGEIHTRKTTFQACYAAATAAADCVVVVSRIGQYIADVFFVIAVRGTTVCQL
jgi:hypothetical protein